jgi:hypothetical protein
MVPDRAASSLRNLGTAAGDDYADGKLGQALILGAPYYPKSQTVLNSNSFD